MNEWNVKPCVTTDCLLGVCSISPVDKQHHYFLCDIDNPDEEAVMKKIGMILFKKEHFGHVYLVKSGKGFHVVSFSKLLTLEEYVELLEEMEADTKFIYWVNKVKYGVLRLSRRSSHRQVPKLVKVLLSPYHTWEDIKTREIYFSFLNMEEQYEDIIRVKVKHDKKN